MSRVRLAILSGMLLVLAGAPPAYAQRDAFLGALRAIAVAQPNPTDRARAVREAADRMRTALAAWDRSIAEMESRASRESATGAGAFQLHVQLGLAYRTRGRLADALREFDAALAPQPSSSDLQILRALTLESMGRSTDASRAFETAWVDDPASAVKAYYVAERTSGQDRASAQAALIRAYGDVARADSKDARRVQKDAPQRPFVTLDPIPDDLSPAPIVADEATAEAFRLLRADRYADAVTALEAAPPARPEASGSPAAHLARGRAAEVEGRVGDARREYEAALQGTLAGRAALYVGIARLAQVEGDSPGAIDAFTRASRLQPNDANIHKELALALEPQGRTDEALCEAIAALLIDPHDAQAHAIVGQIYLDNGRPADALSALNRALTLQPDRYETHYALATALTRLGRTSDADHEFQLFERGRVDALGRRRRQIEHDVDQEEAARRAHPAENVR